MFENIIGQTRVVDELEKAVINGNLPGSLLFSGEHYSGKLSTALELARVLSCTGDKSWNCVCKSCENHRLLLHPYLHILGSSLFMDEINICADKPQDRTTNLRTLYVYQGRQKASEAV